MAPWATRAPHGYQVSNSNRISFSVFPVPGQVLLFSDSSDLSKTGTPGWETEKWFWEISGIPFSLYSRNKLFDKTNFEDEDLGNILMDGVRDERNPGLRKTTSPFL